MTDPISTYTRFGRALPGSSAVPAERRVPGPQSDQASALPMTPARGDQVVLSETVREATRGEPFDRAKIDAIKEALRNGQYPLDSRKIAESFYAIERLID